MNNPTVTITINITSENAREGKAEMIITIPTENVSRPFLSDKFLEIFDKAMTQYQERNAPGTSSRNPIIVNAWSEVDKPGYYAHVNKPGWYVYIDYTRSYAHEDAYYSLSHLSLSPRWENDTYTPLASANLIKTWKTIKGVTRYIENQLKDYWNTP